jgi:hypothetical protein
MSLSKVQTCDYAKNVGTSRPGGPIARTRTRRVSRQCRRRPATNLGRRPMVADDDGPRRLVGWQMSKFAQQSVNGEALSSSLYTYCQSPPRRRAHGTTISQEIDGRPASVRICRRPCSRKKEPEASPKTSIERSVGRSSWRAAGVDECGCCVRIGHRSSPSKKIEKSFVLLAKRTTRGLGDYGSAGGNGTNKRPPPSRRSSVPPRAREKHPRPLGRPPQKQDKAGILVYYALIIGPLNDDHCSYK